jgi:hypothetical protein
MKLFYLRIVVALAILTALVMASAPIVNPSTASAASSSQFSQANSAIENAYTAVYNSQVQNHGNVSNLIDQLNVATQLLNSAISENSTNPAQATSDLLNAESIAQQVTNETASVSSAGMKVYQFRTYESIGVAVAIVTAAGLIYVFLDFIYKRWWFDTFQNYSVRLRKQQRNAK